MLALPAQAAPSETLAGPTTTRAAGKTPPAPSKKETTASPVAKSAAVAKKAVVANPRPNPRKLDAAAGLVRPDQLRTGGLLLETRRKARFLRAPRISTDMRVEVTGPIARTRVSQAFSNPSEGWVEGLYVFPLPEGASVDDLDMRIGNRRIEGRIVARDRLPRNLGKAARYRSLAKPGRDGRRMFISRVANIGPGEMVTVRLDYQQTLEPAAGTFRLRLPLRAAPVSVGAGKTDERVSVSVDLKAGFPLGKVKSHNQEVATEPKSDSHVLLHMTAARMTGKDFVLSWEPAASDKPVARMFRERVGGSDYLLATILPAGRDPSAAKPARELILAIDTSSSMAGLTLKQAKPALKLALARLRETDRFNVIRFGTKAETLFPASVVATGENIARANAFLDDLKGEGGTEMQPPLEAALRDTTPTDEATVRQVVFLTDGAIRNARPLFKLIGRQGGRTRLYPVAIGSGPDRALMRRMAQLGRGDLVSVRLRKDVGRRLVGLFSRLEAPLATDLSADWSAVRIDGSPVDPLPDLFEREPVTLVAKVDNLAGHLLLRGRSGGKPWVEMVDLSKAEPGSGIGKLFAGRLIDRLETSRRAVPRMAAKLDRRIARLALEQGLVSRKTRLVAVETVEKPPATAGLSRALPPLGLVGKAHAGTGPVSTAAADKSARPMLLAMLNVASAPVSDAVAGPIAGAAGKLVLPITATPAQRRIEAGLLLLVFGMVLAGAALMWQQVSRQVKRTPRSGWEDWS